MPKKIDCPTCQKSHAWDTNNIHRPFCSERCKLIDLGAWANEEHVIAGSEVISTETSQNSDNLDGEIQYSKE